MLATAINPPTLEEIKKLTMFDVAIMSGLADSLRNTLKEYIRIDPYTMADPFGSDDDFNYSMILDKSEPTRVVAMIISKLGPSPNLPWQSILGNGLVRLSLSKAGARELKTGLMPKDTNNFYQFRKDGKVSGFIMFAFQICGQNWSA